MPTANFLSYPQKLFDHRWSPFTVDDGCQEKKEQATLFLDDIQAGNVDYLRTNDGGIHDEARSARNLLNTLYPYLCLCHRHRLAGTDKIRYAYTK